MKKAIIGIVIAAVIAAGGYGIYRGVSSKKKRCRKVTTQQLDTKTATKSEATTTTTGSHSETSTSVTPDQALNLLKEGNKRFVEDKSQPNNVDSKRRQELESGQHPYATIVSCSDSRVTPALVFNAGLGDIFDVRLAGDVVDDAALGSIEYAVDHLHTPLIVVMGHEKCGAVTAAYDDVVKGQKAHGHVEDLVDEIKPAINKNGTVDDAIRKNAQNVANEIEKDPVVAQAIKAGKLKVVTAYYDLDGTVQFNS